MSVPEASVDEDAGAVFAQHDVGLSGQSPAVDAITESIAPQPFAHNHFGPCILRPDGHHVVVPLLGRMPIHSQNPVLKLITSSAVVNRGSPGTKESFAKRYLGVSDEPYNTPISFNFFAPYKVLVSLK